MRNGFAIALAWPETRCKQAGAWYDSMLNYLGINDNGFYKVGHAAIVLIDDETDKCSYFDFGRYHAPHGYGRVRSEITDHDLKINTKARISVNKTNILNLEEILTELYHNNSTHGLGTIFSAVTRVNVGKALKSAIRLQKKEIIPYGPFIPKGTNCSRFVNTLVKAGNPSYSIKLKLQLPPMLTPTPLWNIKAIGGQIIKIDPSYFEKEIVPNKLELEMIPAS